jgi:hypothetical protein
MRRERKPDSRYLAVMRMAEEPKQEHEQALWRHLNGVVFSDVMERVVDLYEDPFFEREQVQAWIIAGAEDTRIHQDIGVSLAVLPAFRHLCCNLSNFRDRLELLRWVRNYEGSPLGRAMLAVATHFDGVEALAHHSGRESKLSASHVQEQTMREAYFRSMRTLRMNTLNSTEGSAAHSMLKTAMNAAALVSDGGTGGNLSDLLAKLKFRELTHEAGAAVPREEIVH